MDWELEGDRLRNWKWMHLKKERTYVYVASNCCCVIQILQIQKQKHTFPDIVIKGYLPSFDWLACTESTM